jgi:aspartate/methionine/tyrosine aminotransferase
MVAPYVMPVADRIEACLSSVPVNPHRNGFAPKNAATIDLSRDWVDEVPPPHVIQAAKDALDAGETHYTDRPGVPALRAAVAADVNARHGTNLSASQVVISSGGLEATFVALWVALAKTPGSSVVLTDPGNPALATLACLAGARAARATTSVADGFVLRAGAVHAAVDQETRLLIVSSPNAVTGVSVPPTELAAIGRLAVERDFVLVLDESAARCLYPDHPATSLRNVPGLADRTVIVGSFSRDYRLAGWRVGYFAATAAVFARMKALKQALSICSAAVSQFAALAALTGPQAWIERQRADFALRRATLAGPLEERGLHVVPADAFPFVLVDVEPLGYTGDAAAARVADAGIAVRSGREFGDATAHCIRLTLAAEPDALAAAAERVATTLGRT